MLNTYIYSYQYIICFHKIKTILDNLRSKLAIQTGHGRSEEEKWLLLPLIPHSRII